MLNPDRQGDSGGKACRKRRSSFTMDDDNMFLESLTQGLDSRFSPKALNVGESDRLPEPSLKVHTVSECDCLSTKVFGKSLFLCIYTRTLDLHLVNEHMSFTSLNILCVLSLVLSDQSKPCREPKTKQQMTRMTKLSIFSIVEIFGTFTCFLGLQVAKTSAGGIHHHIPSLEMFPH